MDSGYIPRDTLSFLQGVGIRSSGVSRNCNDKMSDDQISLRDLITIDSGQGDK